MIRLRAVSFDENESVFSCLNSGILHLSLSPDEVRQSYLTKIVLVVRCVYITQPTWSDVYFFLQEYPLLKNVPNSHFPIYISVNFSLTSADT